MNSSDRIDLEDLFVIAGDKTVYVVRKELYREQPKLSLGDGINLYLQPNRVGQALAKVVKKNIENMLKDTGSAKTLGDAPLFQKLRTGRGRPDYQTGYWFDLRMLRLLPKDGVPDLPLVGEAAHVINVTEDVGDNLYLVAWEEPDNPKNNEFNIYYVDASVVLGEKAPESDAKALQDYFIQSGSQVGALTENERKYLGMHGACYIANLSSFRR